MATILDKINAPQDLRIIKKELLGQLSQEIREEIIQTVSQTGGHLASSLGAVEIAVALHYVYNSPTDKIIWDVGHQAYAHKLLTGRRNTFKTQRTFGGLSGFPKRTESEHDVFGTGHSSTSISAALGMAAARDMKGGDNKVVAVIGDGSMTSGLSFEGMQNVGHLGSDMLVVLNDNEMFISHRVGALAAYFAKLTTGGLFKNFEHRVEDFFKRMHFWGSQLLRVAKRFKVLLFPGMLFEEMGFSYLGPVDGHDVHALIEILSNVKKLKGPVLLHVITKKGKGYKPAESEPTKFHGVGRFNIITGEPEAGKGGGFTKVFGSTLQRLARADERIVAVTAAMSEGTGLADFAKEFPKRTFDVGIAEGHALTFAAGLAADGIKPVVAIYSTFLQRSVDQIIHDIALQKLPVIMAIDRAGLVGEDGATHHGAFDLSYLRYVPDLAIMAPADENELQHMLFTAVGLNVPVAIRYPRGTSGSVTPMDKELKALPLGRAEVKVEGKDLYILAIGSTVVPCVEAAALLKNKGISAGVVNMRFAKPLDVPLIQKLARETGKLVVVEENSIIGGLYGAVCEQVAGGNTAVLPIALPDQFVEHGAQTLLRDKYGLTAEKIAFAVENWK